MAISEEDAEFEEDDELVADIMAEPDAFAANNQLHNGMLAEQSAGDDYDEEVEENGDEDMLSAEDGEGDEMAGSAANNGGGESDEVDEDEDGEGVGAVKIQPGLLDEDDEDAVSGSEDDDEGSVASLEDDDLSKDSTDNEAEVEWVSNKDAEEEEEPVNPNRCM